jgi:hypothetical protein
MNYFFVKKSNDSLNIIWIVIIILFIIITLISIIKNKELFNNSYKLGVCSKNCCATQWNIPIDIKEKSKVNLNDVGKKYYTSNLTCNNGIIDTGCVCLDKKSTYMLSNRGYIKNLPNGNGLLDSDNTTSVFKIMDDNKKNIMKNTNKLTGKKGNIIRMNNRKQDTNINNNISNKNLYPIDNNELQWKNDGLSTETEELLQYQIGKRDKDIIVNRK